MVALTPPHLLTLKHASAGRGPAERRREHERVREDERRRLGADLHDNLGQHLTGLACLAAALREELRRAGSALAAQADQLARAAATAHEVTRRLAHGLCPPQLARRGLRAALEDLGDSVRRLHPVTCIFEPKGPPGREAPDTAAQVFCIAQEAIANAIRHGHARKIVIRLETAGPSLRLAIEDDGTGFDPATPAGAGGLGRQLMEHRAALIGGQLRILPLRRGMRVECLFPSAHAAHASSAA